MVLWVVVLVAVTAASAVADESAERGPEAARRRIIDAEIRRAFEASKTLPPVSERGFVKWWRPAIASLTRDMCACDFAEKICARIEMDEFYVDMMQVVFRLKGVRELIVNSKNVDTEAREFTERILEKHVPAKERLRIQAKLEKCINRAVGRF